MSGNPVFCTPLNTPPDFHSLWGWLDFTQTCLLGGWNLWQEDWPGLSPEQQLHVQNEHHPANWPLEGNLKEQEHWRTSEDGLASTTDSWLQRPSYEHDRQPVQQPFESSAHFYQEFMVYLEVIFFIYLFFLQHREFDLTVHFIADTVTLTGFFLMLIYMGLAFSWVHDVIPHGSCWY